MPAQHVKCTDLIKRQIHFPIYQLILNCLQQGDSGGPLVCQSMTGEWSLYGVNIFGSRCKDTGKLPVPTVAAKVSKYTKWIEEQMIKHSSGMWM